MRLHRLLAILAASALCALSPTASASTDGGLRVEVLVDGRSVREYRDRGTTYVEALRGREYAIRLTNLEGRRVAVALAVDGRNTIDGKRTSAANARKWVLDAWESITVSGWQVDDDRARRFYFTTEDRSYADWLGDTANTGVIEAVAFRERAPQVGYWERRPAGEADAGSSRGRAGGAAAPPSASASAQSSAKAESPSRDARVQEREEAATGIGRDVRHDVVRVDFEPESSPSSQVRIRYEWRDALVALGVLPQPEPPSRWSRRERATGFTDGGWCPEPGR